MKLRKCAFLTSIGAVVLSATMTLATLLNVTPGLPLITFNSTGTTVYNATTHLLEIDATPLLILPAVGPPSPIFPGIDGLSIEIRANVSNGGAVEDSSGLVPNIRVTGSIPAGPNGVLIEGNILDMGWADSAPGSTLGTDHFDFLFTVTGGLLAGEYAGSDIALIVTSENSNFGGDFSVNFNGGAKGSVGPVPAVECSIQVDKIGCVILPPASADDACDGKLIDITLRYTGENCDASVHMQSPDKVSCAGDPASATPVRIVISDESGSLVYADVASVPLDGEITASAVNAGLDNFKSKTFASIYNADGVLLQELEFHTSCSQPLAPGNQFGSLFVQEMTTTNGGTDIYEPPTDDCITEFLPSAGGGCDGKLVSMLLQFSGGDCSQSNHSQNGEGDDDDGDDDDDHDDHGVQCDGDSGIGPVRILVTNKNGNRVYADVSNVPLNGTVLASAANAGKSKIDKETRVRIFDADDNLLQSIQFHTSCSQPLELGDQFGGVRIIGMQSTNGGSSTLFADVDYTYTITNTGNVPLTDVSVIDDLLGDVAGGLIPSMLPGEVIEFTVPAFVYETTTNVVTAQGVSGSCTATDTSSATITFLEPPVSQDCCESGNKLQSVTATYTGDDCSATMHSQDPRKVSCEGDPAFEDPVFILATDKKHHDDNHAKIWFEGEVALGGQFVINALNAGKSKLKSKTYVYIFDLAGNLLQEIEFHTSCSQPLVIGDQFGGIQIDGCEQEGGTAEGFFCSGNAKPQALVMEYDGSDCSASSNTQDPSKVFCEGDPAMETVVRILAIDKVNPNDSNAMVWFDGPVILGTTFVIDAMNAGKSKLKSRTYVFIYDLDDILLQQLEFHTSCSQPLNQDDQFGSLILRDFIPE